MDPSALRLALARRLGASAGIDASREDPFSRLRALHGRSPVLGAPMCATDGFVEASGSAEVLRGVLAHARRDARLVVVALHDREVPVSFLMLLIKELRSAERWSIRRTSRPGSRSPVRPDQAAPGSPRDASQARATTSAPAR